MQTILRDTNIRSALRSKQRGFLMNPSRMAPYIDPNADPYFNNVSLLLHCNGTNGSTTIIDSSPRTKYPTRSGTGIISTAQSKFGGSSYQVTNSSSYITVPSDTDTNMGTGDFTIEAWVYPTSLGNFAAWISKQAGSSYANYYIGYMASGALFVGLSGSGDNTGGAASGIVVNTWNHLAATRAGTTARFFTNGVLKATWTNSSNLTDSNTTKVGGGWSGSLAGYIDEVRITKGVARYTAAFTPPTTAFPNF